MSTVTSSAATTKRPEQPERAHARRLEGRHLQIAGQAAAREQHGDQQGHGQV